MTTTHTNHRVLVIDDTESIHADFRKTLISPGASDDRLSRRESILFGDAPSSENRRCFLLDSAMQGEEGLAKVRQAVESGEPYAVAFVDMRMPPGWDGLKTIQHLWGIDPHLQVVICTAYSDYSLDRIVQELGTTDRLLVLKKPFDAAEVSQLATALTEKWSLSRRAEMKLDELERLVRDRTQAAREAAYRDQLTGLPNRVRLTEQLAAAVGRWRERGERFAAMYLDFDRFKVINDSLGHTVGDELLIAIARRLEALLDRWSADHVARCTPVRVGGDEFVVLVEGHGRAELAVELARCLVEALGEPYRVSDYDVTTTVSIGITTSEHGYDNPDHVSRDADAAMYAAKSRGKNRQVMFDRSMHEQMLQQHQLETDLRRAMAEDQFKLVYQPIVDLNDGRMLGVESLLRWEHPRQGHVSPECFIPIAEETGLIRELGRWVLERAARQQAAWRQAYPRQPIYVAVNLSKRQLLEPDFVEVVRGTLHRHGVEAGAMMLEVTETSVMDDRHSVTDVLGQLKALGGAAGDG